MKLKNAPEDRKRIGTMPIWRHLSKQLAPSWHVFCRAYLQVCDLVPVRSTRADGQQKNGILLPNPEIHPLLEVGFLLTNQIAVRDDVVGFQRLHGADTLVLEN